MSINKIVENIFAFGSKDPERRLFDQLIPLPEGTTYNNYLVKGSEKVALIDTMYPKKIDEFIQKLDENGVKTIDYIISNHAEQDHSGALPVLLEKYPDAIIVTNAKCKEIIECMLHVDSTRFQVIADGEELSLGDKTLQFIIAPWVHWPDTMFTYVKEDKVLFTCDYLGAHYTQGGVMADYSDNLKDAAKRYYAEIIMPFRTLAAKYLEKVKALNPSIIAPSHGPVYDKPSFILDLYADWTSDKVKNVVLIPYVSMYESTKILVDRLTAGLKSKDIGVIPFDLIEEDEGELAMHLVDCAGVVIGASMVLAGPHPKAVCATYLINAIRPKLKFYSIVGSYGWGGSLTGIIESLFTCIKPEKLDYVIVKGKPHDEDLNRIDNLVSEIAEKIKEIV